MNDNLRVGFATTGSSNGTDGNERSGTGISPSCKLVR